MTSRNERREELIARVELARNERREELIARVELAVSKDNLKTKDQHQEKMKCSECGKSYLGQKNSSTCGDKCRQRKSRG